MKREKTTLFGIPVTIVDEEALMTDTNGTGAHTHMVVRVADAAITEAKCPVWPALAARRFKIPCIDCRELCWFDPQSTPAPGLGQIVCIRCMLARNGDDTLVEGYDAALRLAAQQ